jgi:hypothetical protein
MHFRNFALVLTVMIATPAMAETDAASSTKPEKPKKICRDEGATGTIFTKRICHTAAEWHAIDEANSHATDAVRNRSTAVEGSR